MVVERVDGTELKFKNPGRLLLVVIGFLFWAIGFIDLLGHTSADPDVFGLYSLPFFILIILYGSTIVIWFALFFNANLLSRVADLVKSIQERTWLVIMLLIGIGFAFWVIFEWDRWLRLPGLQLSAFGLTVLVLLILLFSYWNENKGQQRWRIIIAYPLIALLLIEAVIQILVWFNFVPGTHIIGGDFVPYERIYNNTEGFRNDFANRKGWTFPDSEMDDENFRILVVGGSYVQGLQVEPDQQVSSYLSGMINRDSSDQEEKTEIIGIGLPGFGPAPFLYEDALIEIPQILPYDEIVVLFHLGDDFQSPELSNNAIGYTVGNNGEVEVRPEDARVRHDLTHYYLRGYLSFQLVETLRSNYLTPKLVSSYLSDQDRGSAASASTAGEPEFDFTRLVGSVTSNYALNEPGHAGIKTTDQESIPQGNNFIFRDTDSEAFQEAVIIAESILRTAQEITSANGATLRIVTVPVFPESFYSTFKSNDWQAQIGDYDLFSPEQALVDIAQKYGISILPMGSYMLNQQLTVEEIKSFYLSDGVGHFSPEGHEYYAEAINRCFYSGLEPSACIE
jgi:hypothetical protein